MAVLPQINQTTRKALLAATVEDDAIGIPTLGALTTKNQGLVEALMGVLGGRWHPERRAYVFDSLVGIDLADRYYGAVMDGAWDAVDNARVIDTPAWLARRMVEVADVRGHHRVLEPSAGNGGLLVEILERVDMPEQVTVCEIQDNWRERLATIGLGQVEADFLGVDFGPIFDRVVMHPPFARGIGVRHVWHAMTQLKPGGRLVSVLPPGLIARRDRTYRELREEVVRHGSVIVPAETAPVGRAPQVEPVLVVWTRPADAVIPIPDWPREEVRETARAVPSFRRLGKP